MDTSEPSYVVVQHFRQLHLEVERMVAELHRQLLDAKSTITTLTAERDALVDEKWSLARLVDRRNHEVQGLTAELDAWHSAFGTTQLTHATERLRVAEFERDALAERVRELEHDLAAHENGLANAH
jgi:hypothetical protein